jgi:hypothetical protein
VNGCFGYDQHSNQLNQCDGKAAADMFCREKHYGHSTGYHVSTCVLVFVYADKMTPMCEIGCTWSAHSL